MRRDPADGEHVRGCGRTPATASSSKTGCREASRRRRDRRVGGVPRVLFTSSNLSRAAPERSLFAMKPSAPLRSISGPYEDRSRLETRTTFSSGLRGEQSLGDGRAVEVREAGCRAIRGRVPARSRGRARKPRLPPRRRHRTPPSRAARSRSGGSSNGRRRRAGDGRAAPSSGTPLLLNTHGRSPSPAPHYL